MIWEMGQSGFGAALGLVQVDSVWTLRLHGGRTGKVTVDYACGDSLCDGKDHELIWFVDNVDGQTAAGGFDMILQLYIDGVLAGEGQDFMQATDKRWSAYSAGHFGSIDDGTEAEVLAGMPTAAWTSNEGAQLPEKLRYWVADVNTVCPVSNTRQCNFPSHTPDATYTKGDELPSAYPPTYNTVRVRKVFWEAPSVTFPDSESAITDSRVLWEQGGTSLGAWLGIRKEGDTRVLRLRAGEGSSHSAFSGGDSDTVIVDFNLADSPLLDGKTHHVMWAIQPGSTSASANTRPYISLWVDGELLGTSQKDVGAIQIWANTDTGNWGQNSNKVCDGWGNCWGDGSDAPSREAGTVNKPRKSKYGGVGKLYLYIEAEFDTMCPRTACP
mmetsp:Transcript_20530/g.39879  ORF Transcript_20530/g.39879 Transcript_20530/m.39879 type:complete len:384 (+) Transcript_20530:327-1478(+)|eukprot:CAMPEP_0173381222 /NCGR_PEP_ID=MMETSP1356-20130122/3645_1 /TAXON_ID=77927 ORGANISM="Hemiselmis virescens, Strain PCC157" /NCGR_SAMPLE_ID=MMETSP1356 /ASSEMBLY_ACC=CAM_ASM_000847 /LENGTH=383 /DNA_ID=CAMNT_0014334981 /DNA_START=308 /DNA_END=1459 /DNA_ORIENTATION=-